MGDYEKPRATGVVAWYKKEKGYGLIYSDATPGGAVVVFASIQMEVSRFLTKGQRVEFEPVYTGANNMNEYVTQWLKLSGCSSNGSGPDRLSSQSTAEHRSRRNSSAMS
jgi:cold shock CspA family protein